MRKIALIGGDKRHVHAAEALYQMGFTPVLFGNAGAEGSGFDAPYTLDETLCGAEALLLPVPTCKTNDVLHTPLYEKTLTPQEVALHLDSTTTVFLWGEKNKDTFSKNKIIDLSLDPQCLLQNARATAEAALLVGMQESGRAIFDSKAVVVGYGRIGSLLAGHLLTLGAQVRVGARRDESRRAAETLGCLAHTPEDRALYRGANCIFNTVSQPILSREMLSEAARDAVFIELASDPGGLLEKDLPIRYVKAASLPGRFCPVSAGRFLAHCIAQHLNERKEVVTW